LASIPPLSVSVPSEIAVQTVNYGLESGYLVLEMDALLNVTETPQIVPQFELTGKATESIFFGGEKSLNQTAGGQLCGAGEFSCAAGATCCQGKDKPYACW
jgi:hypothetical protein